jgi:hypothetical protein
MFVLKVAVVTIVFVLIMQIKIGEETVENQAHYFLKTSILLKPLEDVAQGGVALFRSTYRGVVKTVDSVVTSKFKSSFAPGRREIVNIKRSETYKKEQEFKKRAQEEVNPEEFE